MSQQQMDLADRLQACADDCARGRSGAWGGLIVNLIAEAASSLSEARAEIAHRVAELNDISTAVGHPPHMSKPLVVVVRDLVKERDTLRQQIALIDPLDDEGRCAFCFGKYEHKPECIWQQTQQPKDGAEK